MPLSWRRLALGTAVFCALVLVPAGAADAATTLGDPTLNATGPDASFCNTARCLVYQQYPPTGSTTWASPIGGVVVRWRIVFRAVGGTGGARLRVLHPEGPGAYRAAGTSAQGVPTAAGAYEFGTRLPISKADTIGVDLPAGNQQKLAIDNTATGGQYGNTTPTPVDNTTFNTGYSQGTNDELQLNADVEPDADNDGFGDETQDGCPADPTTHAACPGGQQQTSNTSVARVSGLAFSDSAFAAERSGPPATNASKKAPRGTKVSYTLNEAATVRFTVTRRAKGRTAKHGKKRFCAKPTRKNRKHRRCTRTVTLKGSFTRNGVAGNNSFHFTGRLRGRRLKPGRYLLVATPTAGGKKGKPTSRAFRIVR